MTAATESMIVLGVLLVTSLLIAFTRDALKHRAPRNRRRKIKLSGKLINALRERGQI